MQLSFRSAAGAPIGILNWHATHGTSMNNTNLLLSGDNKGHAALLAAYVHAPWRDSRGRVERGKIWGRVQNGGNSH